MLNNNIGTFRYTVSGVTNAHDPHGKFCAEQYFLQLCNTFLALLDRETASVAYNEVLTTVSYFYSSRATFLT